MIKVLQRLIRDEEGQALVEYGLVLAGVAVAVILAVRFLGNDLMEIFGSVVVKIKAAINSLEV